MKTVIEKAKAKLNLALDVVYLRKDGYHEMDMVNQTVSLYDDIEVSLTDNGITLDTTLVCESGEDLTVRAARLFLKASGFETGVAITVSKHIPVLAGLGGGSADAAAVLRALNRLSGGLLDNNQLCELAADVGADVPFCLFGGTARVRGKGEIISSLPDFPKCTILLVRDGQKSSTADMFARLDCVGAQHPDVCAAAAAVERGDLEGFCAAAGNSFDALWDNESIKQGIREAGGRLALLTGSGPVVYGIFCDGDKAEDCKNAFLEDGFQALLCVPE